LRERPGRGQDKTAQRERDRERGRPDQQQVLRADHAHERFREQAARHGAEDLAGREQWEQALRATGVGDHAGGAPDEDVLQQDRERHGQPQHREDPPTVGEQREPFGQDDGAEPRRDREVGPPTVDAPEQRGQAHHEHERGRALREIHQR
jgi:hypothetical protein